MKKQYKASIIKDNEITIFFFLNGVPLNGYVASSVIFTFRATNEKKTLWEYPVTNDA